MIFIKILAGIGLAFLIAFSAYGIYTLYERVKVKQIKKNLPSYIKGPF